MLESQRHRKTFFFLNNIVKGHVRKWLKMIPAKERRERRKERRRIKEGMTDKKEEGRREDSERKKPQQNKAGCSNYLNFH